MYGRRTTLIDRLGMLRAPRATARNAMITDDLISPNQRQSVSISG
jgi:hypothetical protein